MVTINDSTSNPVFKDATRLAPLPQVHPDFKQDSSCAVTPINQSLSLEALFSCPVAKQYGCSGYFSTSGPAARHARKHNRKKDNFCPVCNRSFARKDNMEQHRRTYHGVTDTKQDGQDSLSHEDYLAG